jgi:hypothetical protein
MGVFEREHTRYGHLKDANGRTFNPTCLLCLDERDELSVYLQQIEDLHEQIDDLQFRIDAQLEIIELTKKLMAAGEKRQHTREIKNAIEQALEGLKDES